MNRERDIQNILFQVSEMFAPFDVQVLRMYGAGEYSYGFGDTTIFIGANSRDFHFALNSLAYSKIKASWTPPSSLDTAQPGPTVDTQLRFGRNVFDDAS
jgi:hypothetical protein